MTTSISGSLLIPPPIKAGDTIGVVSASGPVLRESLEQGLRYLERAGFHIKLGRHIFERNDFLAGTDEQRSRDLNSMLEDSHTRAIIFARGGYGSMRILESLNCDAIIADPKIMIGMSDITALQLSLFRRCKLVTFAGPMVAAQIADGLDDISSECLLKCLMEPIDHRNLWPDNCLNIRIIQQGEASGVLIGGCLSLVTALLGTDHLPDFRGKILFLEDVNEPLYRLDRMMMQMKLSGHLEELSGLILGHFAGPDQPDPSEGLDALVMNLVLPKSLPIVSGFPHGHRLPNLALPVGVPVRLDTRSRELIVQLGLDSPREDTSIRA